MGDSNNTSVKLITLDNLETYHGLMDAKKEEHSVELTQAQYDALSPEEKMNGKTYYITDADPEYGSDYATADSVAPVENGSTSTAAYAVDDYIYRNGKLYKVIATISIGDSFVVNTNISETRISDEFGSGGGPETVDYNSAENKPQINGVTLSGNKSGSDLGLVSDPNYVHTDNNYTTTEKNKLEDLYTPKTYRGLNTRKVDTNQYISGRLIDFNPLEVNSSDILFFKAETYEIDIGKYYPLSNNVNIRFNYNDSYYYLYLYNRYFNSLGEESWGPISELSIPKGATLVLSNFRHDIRDSHVLYANILNFINNNQFVLEGWLYEGDTTLTFSDNRLMSTSILDVYFDSSHADLSWNTFTETTQGFSLTFDPQDTDILVIVLVTNVTTSEDGLDGESS